ncbi:MAG: HEPN domain-containing protein [Candidatus Heimdallarchaeota archaeon]
MNEIASLLQRASRYLKSAELLLGSGDYESSVSRTYYAMYYSAQAMLLARNLSYSSHRSVISAFGEYFIKTGIFIEKWVENLTGRLRKDR